MSTPLLSPHHIDALDGADWLRSRRAAAAEAAAEVALPSSEAEEWRYSRIEALPLDELHLATGGAGQAVPPEVTAVLGALGETSGHVICVDGVVVASFLDADLAAGGVRLGPESPPDSADAAPPVVPAAGSPDDAYLAWNLALAAAPLELVVPRGVEVPRPLVVVHHIAADAGATFPRLVVRAGEDSGCSVIEVHTSADVLALSAPVTVVEVGPAARVRHAVVQQLGTRVWQVGSVRAEVQRDATWAAGLAVLGGDYGRFRVDCRLTGRGATGNVAAAYLGTGRGMIDLRTFQEHEAPDTTSELYFKGALADAAHSVYTGLIRIHPEARGSNAVQANRVVKLSDDTWAQSVPNLEIHNNDVRCAHASAVGPVDAEQLFYLESRGVPPRAAERLIVGGFFDDALTHFPVPEVIEHIGAVIDADLDREVGVAVAASTGGAPS